MAMLYGPLHVQPINQPRHNPRFENGSHPYTRPDPLPPWTMAGILTLVSIYIVIVCVIDAMKTFLRSRNARSASGGEGGQQTQASTEGGPGDGGLVDSDRQGPAVTGRSVFQVETEGTVVPETGGGDEVGKAPAKKDNDERYRSCTETAANRQPVDAFLPGKPRSKSQIPQRQNGFDQTLAHETFQNDGDRLGSNPAEEFTKHTHGNSLLSPLQENESCNNLLTTLTNLEVSDPHCSTGITDEVSFPTQSNLQCNSNTQVSQQPRKQQCSRNFHSKSQNTATAHQTKNTSSNLQNSPKSTHQSSNGSSSNESLDATTNPSNYTSNLPGGAEVSTSNHVSISAKTLPERPPAAIHFLRPSGLKHFVWSHVVNVKREPRKQNANVT